MQSISSAASSSNPGDVVLVDDPSYFNFIMPCCALIAPKIVGVPFTPNGPDIAAFRPGDHGAPAALLT